MEGKDLNIGKSKIIILENEPQGGRGYSHPLSKKGSKKGVNTIHL